LEIAENNLPVRDYANWVRRNAVAETVTTHDITVGVTDGRTVELAGDSFTLAEGVHADWQR
jgi:hypothetical protein